MIYGLHIVLCFCIHVIGHFFLCFIVKNVFAEKKKFKATQFDMFAAEVYRVKKMRELNGNRTCKFEHKFLHHKFNFTLKTCINSFSFFIFFSSFSPTCKFDPVNRNKFSANYSFIILSFNCYSISSPADITDCKTSSNALFCDTIVTSCTEIWKEAICLVI